MTHSSETMMLAFGKATATVTYSCSSGSINICFTLILSKLLKRQHKRIDWIQSAHLIISCYSHKFRVLLDTHCYKRTKQNKNETKIVITSGVANGRSCSVFRRSLRLMMMLTEVFDAGTPYFLHTFSYVSVRVPSAMGSDNRFVYRHPSSAKSIFLLKTHLQSLHRKR